MVTESQRFLPIDDEELHLSFPNGDLSVTGGAVGHLARRNRSGRADILFGRLQDLNFGVVLGKILEFDGHLPDGLKLAIHESSDHHVAAGRVRQFAKCLFADDALAPIANKVADFERGDSIRHFRYGNVQGGAEGELASAGSEGHKFRHR